MNDYWHTISAMADRATRETGRTVTPDDVFNLARQGVIRVGANIPGWKCAGNGELEWYYPDGSQVGGFDFSDGVARWLDEDQLDTLVRRGEVSLAGTRWPVPGGPTLTAGGPKGSPLIERDDLRVPGDEYPRILAAINGEPSAPREIAGTAPTPARVTLEPWWYLIQQCMELNEHIAEVGKARSNLQQSKQDLAILREELAHLETTPEFLSAVESFVAALKRQFEPIAKSDQQDLIEQRAAEIEYWSALLARLQSEQAIDRGGEGALDDADVADPKTIPESRVQEGAKHPNDGRKTGKREQQIQDIVNFARKQGWDPLNIPTGGKKVIEEWCLTITTLFTASGFDHAWKEANQQKRIRINGKEHYIPR